MNKVITLPNILSSIGIIIAINAMVFRQYLGLALTLVFIDVIIDYADGKIAKFLKQESRLGLLLDSLNDTIGFLLAPVLIIGAQIEGNVYFVLLACLYVLAGIYRLYREYTLNNKTHFTGLTTTASAVLLLVLFTLVHLTSLSHQLVLIGLFILSSLMIAKFPLKRLF